MTKTKTLGIAIIILLLLTTPTLALNHLKEKMDQITTEIIKYKNLLKTNQTEDTTND